MKITQAGNVIKTMLLIPLTGIIALIVWKLERAKKKEALALAEERKNNFSSIATPTPQSFTRDPVHS